MPIILDGTAGLTNNATDLNYTGTLTGGTGVVNLGSGQVVKDASGNLGIGTSSPTYKLDVQSTTNALARIKTNTTGFALFEIDSAASNQAITIFKAGGVEQARIFSAANEAASTLVFARGTAATESMRIDSSGNVGIGTSLPTVYSGFTTLEVGSTSGNAGLFSAKHANGNALMFNSAGSAQFGATGAFPTVFLTASVERARIDASGNLLVGQTARTEQNSNSFSFDVLAKSVYVNHSNGTSSNTGYAYFGYNAINIGSITQAGTTAVLYNTTSDYRLKTVIGPVANAGQRIDSLQPVEYTWNASGERTRGFLAHQFQEVYAGSVSGTKDAVDAEGKPVYQSMQASTSEVIADLVVEIQSLRQRLATAGI